ncbi:MAG: preprotein translocase subunit YajC [Propionibacteriaceae bacterium]|jgi:preprotein translocase subunit YajC|nr:preprotein translocase subunit YajC [Propionibacteriaceae bacterium]
MSSSIGMILMIVAFGAIMYFLMIRPAKKQQQKQQDMLKSLEPGARIVTGSGIYGTIRHLGEKQVVIEISPGVDLTIARAAIRGTTTDAEEEFEYADSADLDEISSEEVNPFAEVADSSFVPDSGSAADLSFAPPSETTTDDNTDTIEQK